MRALLPTCATTNLLHPSSPTPSWSLQPSVTTHLRLLPGTSNMSGPFFHHSRPASTLTLLKTNGGQEEEEGINSLQLELQRERGQRRNGLIAGGSFMLIATILGCVLGFFDLTIIEFAVSFVVITMAYVVESFNEYQFPLPESSVQVRESTIPGAGMGLFATTSIQEGTFLMEYIGEILTENEYFDRYPDGSGRYVAQITKGFGISEPVYIDGLDPNRSGVARYMNSRSGSGANVFWKKQRFGKQAGKMHFYSLRKIEAGEELFFDYGDSYWLVANDKAY